MQVGGLSRDSSAWGHRKCFHIAATCHTMRELRDKMAKLYGKSPVHMTLYLPTPGRRKRLLFCRFPDDTRSGLVHIHGCLAGLMGLAQVLRERHAH